MKTTFISACAAALWLSACNKQEVPLPVSPPAPKVGTAAPAAAMSGEDKAKAMDAAKAAAKSAGGGKE